MKARVRAVSFFSSSRLSVYGQFRVRAMHQVSGEPFKYVKSYVPYLFDSLFDRGDAHLKSAWQESIDIATKVAALLVESAVRSGINHEYYLEKCIQVFIREHLLVSNIHPYKQNYLTKEDADRYRKKVKRVLDVLEQCDLDAVMTAIFADKNMKLSEACIRFFVDIVHIQYDLKYLPDLIAICRFLHDVPRVQAEFDQLEKALQHYAENRQLPKACDGRYTLPPVSEGVYKRHKILSGYLYQWAKEHGFEQKAKIITALQYVDFAKLLLTKSFFKDSHLYLNGTHGIWSHALMFWVVINAGFLKNQPLALFQELGRQIHDDYGRDKHSTDFIWNCLFDTRIFNENFTNPDFYSRTLEKKSSRERWPLLAESVVRAQQKNIAAKRGELSYLHLKHMDEQELGIVFRRF